MFGETRRSLGTNLFGVFCCVEAFGTVWMLSGQIQLAKSESIGVGGLDTIGYSDWLSASCSMTILIGGVLANQHSLWEGPK